MIDFSTGLKTLDGHPLYDGLEEVNGAKKLLTLGRAAANALLATTPDDAKMPGAEKIQRYALAMKVVNASKIKLPSEEVSLIKSSIDKIYGPLVVGQAWAMLEEMP